MHVKIDEECAFKLSWTIRKHIQDKLLRSFPQRDILVFLKHDNLLVVERETGTFLYRPCRGVVAIVSATLGVNKTWAFDEVENPRFDSRLTED